MGAWMNAWLACAASLAALPDTEPPPEQEPLASVPPELIDVLASMALGQIQEEAA